MFSLDRGAKIKPPSIMGYSTRICPICCKGVIFAYRSPKALKWAYCRYCKSQIRLIVVEFSSQRVSALMGFAPIKKDAGSENDEQIVLIGLKSMDRSEPIDYVVSTWEKTKRSIASSWVCPICSKDCSDAEIEAKSKHLLMTCTKCQNTVQVLILSEYQTGIQIVIEESRIATQLQQPDADLKLLDRWRKMSALDPDKRHLAIGVIGTQLS
jgi:hypothetical protein